MVLKRDERPELDVSGQSLGGESRLERSADSFTPSSTSLFSFEFRASAFTKLASSSSSSSVFLPQIHLRLFSYPLLVFNCVDDGVLELLRREVDAEILALAVDEDLFRHNVDEAVLETLIKVIVSCFKNDITW